jgi:CheY-like chemotaxis protein
VGPVVLASVIDGALESVRPAAEARQIEIQTDIPPLRFTMLGDPDRLQQVIWNLLSNAVKFTPSGGRVTLAARTNGTSVDVSVRDTGQGIPPGFLPSLFERFRQADASTTRAHGGLGLGLAIVRHLVELHGGTVRGESRGEGMGASFTVSLPLRLPESWRPDDAESRSTDATARQPRRVGRTLSGLSVLVVDDDVDSRQLTRAVLERAGAAVSGAASVDEAEAVLGRRWPTVVIADIGMPGRDGFELLRRVRTLEVGREHRLPVAALTAYAAQSDQQRVSMAGFDAYLSKPVEPGELTATVARLAGLASPREGEGRASRSKAS